MRVLLMLAVVLLVSCGGSESANNADSCEALAGCRDNEIERDSACTDCRTVADGCGETVYCEADPTCETPCPAGKYEAFEACEEGEANCETRQACGKDVSCRDQAICLGETSCPDGGFLLEACPPDSMGCLPAKVCGTTKYCPTLLQCEKDACDPGESPTILKCDDPSIDLPCRELDACAGQVTCICNAEALLCFDFEDFDTAPCTPGQECREVTGCGQTFYCKGDSI